MNNKEASASGCLFTVLAFAAILMLCTAAILQIVFVVFRITSVIAWSWWWVAAPTWITLAGITAMILVLNPHLEWERKD